MNTYPFERYQNIRSATDGSLRWDGRRLAFLTDITGTAQLWTCDGPLRWPEQLTFFDDRLMFAAYSPTEAQIAFGMDSGGDEEQLIYLIDDTGGMHRRLSVHDARHIWGGWSHDGRQVAWSHNGRNGRDFDVYVFDLDTGEERCVYEAEGYNYVAAWLPDDRGLIIGNARSAADSDLWYVRFDGAGPGSAPVHLTPHDEPAFYRGVAPKPDGSGCFVLTNERRDFTNLGFIDFAALGRDRPRCRFVDEHPWDREAIALSDDGRYMVLVSNEAGYSALELHDLEAGTVDDLVQLPAGMYSQVRFSPDSSRFSLTVMSADDTTDVWTVAVDGLEAVRWTRSSAGGLERARFVEPELVHFESFDGLRIPAFYYRPDTADDVHPVVIDIHGGPESQRRPALTPLMQYLVHQGFGVLSPNVRGSTGYGKHYMSLDDVERRMDSVHDIAAAHEWLVREGDADPKRIALMGGSYGGYMVLSAMVHFPALWCAGVDVVGIASLVTFLENTAPYRRHLREREYGSLEHDRELLVELSPLTHIERIAAPLMVIHGANDPRVPVGEAYQVADAVRARGLPVELLVYGDEGHGLAKRANRLDAYPKVVDFLNRHMGRTNG